MKWLAILLCILLVFSGCKRGEHMTGTGTALDPYIITTRADLEAIASDMAAYYELGADIDLAGSNWRPLSWDAGYTTEDPFMGSLDGDGHKISNMTVAVPGTVNYDIGFIGWMTEGTIKNLRLCAAKVTVSSSESVSDIGLLVGCGDGTLTDCQATGEIILDYSASSGNAMNWVGGITGEWYDGTISSCRASLTVTKNQNDIEDGNVAEVGGIAGRLRAGTASACIASLTLRGSEQATVREVYDVGGVAGTTAYDSATTVDHCTATVTASSTMSAGSGHGDDSGWGGLIGYPMGTATITDCHASGNLKAGKEVGGLCGRGLQSTFTRCSTDVNVQGNTNIGGATGIFGTFVDCYALGDVTCLTAGNAYAGGFYGGSSANQGSATRCHSAGLVTVPGGSACYGGFSGSLATNLPVTDSYWDTETSGQSSDPSDAVGKTTVQMQTQSTFTGWDFSTVWNIASGTYPFLRSAFVTIVDGCAATVSRSFPWVGKFQLSHVTA